MGIPITPEPDPFGDNNLTCFPPGETPAIMYATFTGIIKGPGWVPGMPGPPNGQYTLQQDDANPAFWRYDGTTWKVFYFSWFPAPPDKRCLLRILTADAPVHSGFYHERPGSCFFQHTNTPLDPPIAPFIEGHGTLWWLT